MPGVVVWLEDLCHEIVREFGWPWLIWWGFSARTSVVSAHVAEKLREAVAGEHTENRQGDDCLSRMTCICEMRRKMFETYLNECIMMVSVLLLAVSLFVVGYSQIYMSAHESGPHIFSVFLFDCKDPMLPVIAWVVFILLVIGIVVAVRYRVFYAIWTVFHEQAVDARPSREVAGR